MILNIIILPGVGSIVGRKINAVIAQLIIFFWQLNNWIYNNIHNFWVRNNGFGIIIGLPIMILGVLGAWIWALITGIQMVQEAE